MFAVDGPGHLALVVPLVVEEVSAGARPLPVGVLVHVPELVAGDRVLLLRGAVAVLALEERPRALPGNWLFGLAGLLFTLLFYFLLRLRLTLLLLVICDLLLFLFTLLLSGLGP